MDGNSLDDAPKWTDLYMNEPLISIRQYVRQRPGDDVDTTYMRELATLVELYWDEMQDYSVLLETTNRWDDPQCQAMISSITWLTAFVSGSHDVQPALSALSASLNDCTRLLLRFLKLLDNHTIIEIWKTEALDIIKRRETEHSLRLRDYKALSIARYIQMQCECSDVVITSL